MTLGSGGISPHTTSQIFPEPGLGDIGASDGREDKKMIGGVDEEEFDEMGVNGEIERERASMNLMNLRMSKLKTLMAAKMKKSRVKLRRSVKHQ